MTSVPLTSLSLLRSSKSLCSSQHGCITRRLWGTSSASDVLPETFFPLSSWLWGSGNSDSCNSGAQVTSAQPQPCPSALHSPPGPQELSKYLFMLFSQVFTPLPIFLWWPQCPPNSLPGFFIFLILLEGWIPQRKTELLGSTFPFVRTRELLRLQSSSSYSQVLCYNNPLLWEFGRWI